MIIFGIHCYVNINVETRAKKSNLKLLIYTYMKTKWVLGRYIM